MTEIDEETVQRIKLAIDGLMDFSSLSPAYLDAIARAAIAAMPSWRPIDDAPLGEEFILGWWDEWPARVWRTTIDLAGSTKGGWRHGQATHYQPLPPPPKPEGGQT